MVLTGMPAYLLPSELKADDGGSLLERTIAIRSVHNGGYLDSRGEAGWMGAHPVKAAAKDPLANAYRQWVLHDAGGGQLVIKSMHLGGNLDSGARLNDSVTVQAADSNSTRQLWVIEPIPGASAAQCAIRSVYLGGYLDARSIFEGERMGQDIKVFEKLPHLNNYRRWTFVPLDPVAEEPALVAAGRGAQAAAARLESTDSANAAGTAEMLDALHARGEKLETLSSQSAALRDGAEDFHSMAKQLRQQSERSLF